MSKTNNNIFKGVTTVFGKEVSGKDSKPQANRRQGNSLEKRSIPAGKFRGRQRAHNNQNGKLFCKTYVGG